MAPANNYMHMREIAASYTEAIKLNSLASFPGPARSSLAVQNSLRLGMRLENSLVD